MDWVKLTTNYYLDAAVMRAGEAAEVLFTRALAYVGDQESDGVVPREALARLTPTRGTSRATALVREGLWEVVPGGWRFVAWDRHQTSTEDLAATRKAARLRQAKHRARRDGVSNAVTNSEVTEQKRVEVDAAAAAGPPPLPAALEILRNALEARKLFVRWDMLTAEQHTEIEHLIELHGDGALVHSAMRQHQPDKPAVTAQAWLGDWRQLRKPGDLAAVKADPCTEPGHVGTVRHCAQCASERLAKTS